MTPQQQADILLAEHQASRSARALKRDCPVRTEPAPGERPWASTEPRSNARSAS